MPPLLAAAIPAVIGGIGGLTNRRPSSLDPTQRTTLDSLLNSLYSSTQGPVREDPIQRALMFGNIAQEGTLGANRVTNSLVSRGLGRSGLLARGLTENSLGVTAAQNNTDLALQQQAIQQRNQTINQILSLLGVSNIPGQSGIGGFLSGFAGPFSKLLSSFGSGGGTGTTASSLGWTPGSSSVVG